MAVAATAGDRMRVGSYAYYYCPDANMIGFLPLGTPAVLPVSLSFFFFLSNIIKIPDHVVCFRVHPVSAG